MMAWNDFLTLGTGSVWVSGVVWALLAMVVMYAARARAHRVLYLSTRACARWLRTAARLLDAVRGRVALQQHAIHAAQVLDQAERRSDRSVQRIAHAIERDLGAFPQLQRRLSDQIERIDRDYHDSADTPPVPPQWLDAVGAVAEIHQHGDGRVAEILDAMHTTLTRSSQDALDEFRFASRRKHGLLRRMLPQWRRASRMLARLDGNVASLVRRADAIEAQITRYASLRAEPEALTLASEARYWLRFVFSAAALTVLGILAVTEHAVLLAPLNVLLPHAPNVYGLPAAKVEAWVVIGAELVFGMLLLETNRITRMLPGAGLMTRRLRLGAGLLLALLWLATTAFAATLTVFGAPADSRLGHVLATVGGVVLLSLLLLPAGVLVETALNTGRSVLLSLYSGLLALLADVLRAAGWCARLTGRVLIALYDLVIFIPLGVAAFVAAKRQAAAASGEGVAAQEVIAQDVAAQDLAVPDVAGEEQPAPSPRLPRRRSAKIADSSGAQGTDTSDAVPS